jgi:hypothetical protein
MPMSAAARRPSGSLKHALSDTPNSLNLVRLLLALAVIQYHSGALGGYVPGMIFRWTDAGQLAVYGFFGISGYLIAGSALKNSVPRFLWHRILRIFPAFWICLLLTAAVFGWIGWNHAGHHCGVGCYVTEPNGPSPHGLERIAVDALLRVSLLPVDRGAGSSWTPPATDGYPNSGGCSMAR